MWLFKGEGFQGIC